MRAHDTFITAAIAFALPGVGAARAQSAPTCSFDGAAATVTVTVDAIPAKLRAVPATGEIWLNGVPCGGATVLNTDSIQVNGGTFIDTVTLAGTFAPGLTPEPSETSEIEIAFALAGNTDQVIIELGALGNELVFASDGIRVGDDSDRDILTAGTERITVNAGGGDDRIFANAYSSQTPSGTVIELHGEAGNDLLTGSNTLTSLVFGEDGDDLIQGSNGPDELTGGPGNDLEFGLAGDDLFLQGDAADGADDFRGDAGSDTVVYQDRTNGVTVTIGVVSTGDGEPGEGDIVRPDVENVIGGHGADVLVGNAVANLLDGQGADDELHGGGGDDALLGLAGNDTLAGDDGNDLLDGGATRDSLDGGEGDDTLLGGAGQDVLRGGLGADHLDGGGSVDELVGNRGNDTFVNDDGTAETVYCGGGIDDAQPDPFDTFVGCEL